MRGTVRLHRTVALLLALVGVPAALSLSVFLMDAPIRPGEPSPRTVVASDLIRVPDPEATDRARRAASDGVEPVLVDDPAARAAIVQRVSDAFVAVTAAREPDAEGRQATAEEQQQALSEALDELTPAGIAALIALPDDELNRVADDAVDLARDVARSRMLATDV